jgi:hypothetical protein
MHRELSLVLLTFILRFMNDDHPRRRGAANPGRCMPRTRPARRRRLAHGLRRDARVTLDPERIRQTGGDPGAGPSSGAPASSPQAVADLGPTSPAPAPQHRPPLTRGDGWLCPPSPSPERVAERLRASETLQPLRPLRFYPLHGWGPCPARTAAERRHPLLDRAPPPPAKWHCSQTRRAPLTKPGPRAHLHRRLCSARAATG